LVAVVEGLAQAPLSDEEFKRAQVKWLKSWEQQYTNPETVGVALSETVSQGDWRLLFLQRDRIRSLQREDVQRVVQSRFVASNRTLATYVPTERPLRAPTPEAVDVVAQMRQFKAQAATASVVAFDASPANIEARTRRFALPNGMKVALLSKPTRGQTVRVSMALRLGDERSLFGQREVAELAAAMLDKGSATLTRQQVQDRLDALKSELSISGQGDRVSVSLLTHRDTVIDAVALLSQLLRRPAFPAPTLDELQRQIAAQVQAQRDDPEAIVENALARRGDPYPPGDVRHARSFDELLANAKAVTLEQVKAFHGRFYGANMAVFAAVGDFDDQALQRALADGFGDWSAQEPVARVVRPMFPVDAGRESTVTPDKQNAMLGVQLRLPLSDNDAVYPALALANFILGSGGDSRLWKRVREREGLSYSVWSTIDWGDLDAHSTWSGGAIFAPANRDKVERAFREELLRAVKDGFTAQEVDNAKKALLNFRRLSRAQDERLALTLAHDLELGRGFEFAQRVDTALAGLNAGQVNNALRVHLKPDALAFVLAGDFKQP
jgi:zinc protease